MQNAFCIFILTPLFLIPLYSMDYSENFSISHRNSESPSSLSSLPSNESLLDLFENSEPDHRRKQSLAHSKKSSSDSNIRLPRKSVYLERPYAQSIPHLPSQETSNTSIITALTESQNAQKREEPNKTKFEKLKKKLKHLFNSEVHDD
ncbi:MAG: hypothetical protein WD068_00165 [Candidatus Babeliales bacterium]